MMTHLTACSLQIMTGLRPAGRAPLYRAVLWLTLATTLPVQLAAAAEPAAAPPEVAAPVAAATAAAPEDNPLRFSGSIAWRLGLQQATNRTIYTPEGSTSHPSLVSRKLNPIFKLDKTGVFSAVLDGEWDQRPYGESKGRVNQLFASFSLTDSLRLRVGRQRTLWGHGFSYIPTDLINPPLDPSGLDLAKVGVPAVSFDWVRDKYSLTGIVRREQSGIDSAGLKLVTSPVSGVDLNLITYHAPSIGNALGASFAVDATQVISDKLPGLVLYGGLESHTRSRYPEAIAVAASPATGGIAYPALGERGASGRFRSFLLGTTWQINSDLSLTGEYYHIGDAYSKAHFNNLLTLLSERGSLGAGLTSPWLDSLATGRNQRQYYYVSLAQNALTSGNSRLTDTLSATLGLLGSPDDQSRLWSVALKSTYWDRAEVTWRTFVPTGRKVSEFGSLPYNWYSEIGVKIGF